MSKILLIKPRFLTPEFCAITQPLGLLYIASTLKEAGHEPRIHDCALDHKDLQVLRKIILNWEPNFIGISIMVTDVEQTKRIMSLIREILSDVPITLGGPWPSANPEDALKKLKADFVVIGEGEFVFPDLVDAINNGRPTENISGTASMINGNIKINQGRYLTEDELNNLPFPAWELLDHKLYARMPSMACVIFRPYMSLLTSRGCSYQCAYCHQTMGKTFRKRSAESVLSEMEVLRFKYGFKEFEFVDDCFNFDHQRMQDILKGISHRIHDARLFFPHGLRADILEPDDMSLFKKAGTASIAFAIETASPRLQKLIHKNLNINKSVLAINASVKAEIYSVGYFMIGFPTESFEEACSTIEFAAHSTLHCAMFFLVTPFEGTKLAEMCSALIEKRQGSIDPQNVTFYKNAVNISAISDRELQKVFRKAYMRFYLSPKRLIRLAIHHPSFLSLPLYAFLFFMKFLPRRNHCVK